MEVPFVSQITLISGELDFGANIVTSQIWFQQSRSDLVVTVLGTQDRATIVGWYAHPTTQLQRFVTAGGAVLDTQFDQLVQAMATYAVGDPGFAPTTATQAPSDPSQQSVLAAAWH